MIEVISNFFNITPAHLFIICQCAFLAYVIVKIVCIIRLTRANIKRLDECNKCEYKNDSDESRK